MEGINLAFNKIDEHMTCFYLQSIWWSRKSEIENWTHISISAIPFTIFIVAKSTKEKKLRKLIRSNEHNYRNMDASTHGKRLCG